MNLRQLEALYEVMLAGSVSEAARNMGRTQPAVSALIAGLEKAIDCRLFERRSGRLHPLPEAHFLFEEAGTILADLRRLRGTMKEVRDLDRGELRISSMSAAGLFLLPNLVSRFVKERPEVRVTVMTRTSPQVVQNIASQQFDIGIADVGVRDAGEETPLVNRESIRMGCVCALAADDPLAQKATITPSDLDGRPIAALFPEHAIYRATRAAFDQCGATFNVRFESQINIPHFALVEDGAAYAITDPVSAVSYRHYRGAEGGVVFRAFRPAVPFEVAILTPAYRPASRLAQAVLGLVREEIMRCERTWQDGEPTWTAPA